MKIIDSHARLWLKQDTVVYPYVGKRSFALHGRGTINGATFHECGILCREPCGCGG